VETERTQDDDIVEVEKDFRLAMRNVAAPVSVVTTYADGVPFGTTVSAFDSLSMRPPMMTIALQVGSFLLGHLTIGAPLGVNVLAHHQESLAVRFAQRLDDRFADVDWSLVDGAPQLADHHSWIALTVREMVRGGDHVVVVGDVIGAEQGHGRPLTYHDRIFGTHDPL
jgi:flavin reductase (DIM6/NTAB) family NADH-FMN oxidoreductase RutF